MKNIFIICFFSVMFNIASIEYNTYEMKVEHVFSASHGRRGGENDLSLIIEGTNPGPDGPALFFKGNQLVISDQANWNVRKTIFLNEDYSIDKIYEDSFYRMNVISHGKTFLGVNSSYLKVIDSSKGWDMKFSSSQDIYSFLKGYIDVYFQHNTLFIFDVNNKLWAIKEPGLDNDVNKRNIVKEDDIIIEIKDGNYEGLTIDNEKRLFLNGELQTINIKNYFNYISEIVDEPLLILDKKNKENFYIRNNAEFISNDLEGNTYWYVNNRVLVVDKNGNPQMDILITKQFLLPSYPAISPEGDIFFLNYGSDKVTLYKIPRQW